MNSDLLLSGIGAPLVCFEYQSNSCAKSRPFGTALVAYLWGAIVRYFFGGF